MSIETGLPIMRRTACAIGGHVFIYTGSGTGHDPPIGWRCHCELTRWEARAADPTTPEEA